MQLIITKIKTWVKQYQRDLFLVACLLLVAGIGYNIGHISSQHKGVGALAEDSSLTGASIANTKTSSQKKPAITLAPKDPRVVASKASSSKLYHYTYCSGAKRIKDANKLWFDNASSAESAGYTLAGNCTP